MEKEIKKEPEIFKDEALRIVNGLKFEDFEDFSFHNINFLIILINKEDIGDSSNQEEIFLSASTATRGFDIYMLDALSVEDKKRRVFHEIIEADLRRQGFGEESHKLATKTEVEVFGER